MKQRIENPEKNTSQATQDNFPNQHPEENNKTSGSLTFDNTLTPKVHYHVSSLKKRARQEKDYKIYPVSELAILINEMGKYCSQKKKIRYLVDTQFNVWFGLEGTPNSKIPAHHQLVSENPNSAQCIIAGNFEIDDQQRLKMVNNKSGDFKPDFSQLKWVLALLFYHEKQLPLNFLPENIDIENQKFAVIEKYVGNIRDLQISLAPFVEHIVKFKRIAEEKNVVIASNPTVAQTKLPLSNWESPTKNPFCSAFLSQSSTSLVSSTLTSEKKLPSNTKTSFFNEKNNKAFREIMLSDRPDDYSSPTKLRKPNPTPTHSQETSLVARRIVFK